MAEGSNRPTNRNTIMGATPEILQKMATTALMKRTFGPRVDTDIEGEFEETDIVEPTEVIVLEDCRLVIGANNVQLKRGQRVTSIPIIAGLIKSHISIKAVRGATRPTDES